MEEWNKFGKTSKNKWDILLAFITRTKEKYKKKRSTLTREESFVYHRVKYLKEEILLTFLYPRLDAKVSTDIGHLLKSPFCVHPKTGKVCVPFKSEALSTFDPFKTPTLIELIGDYEKGSYY